MSFTIVTGNQSKLAAFKRLLPADLGFNHVDLDLPEIQSFDSQAIITDKLQRAYAVVKRPVLVEDVSAGLDRLNGLPGPFIKFFEQRLGKDALFQLAGQPTPATVSCTIGYYNGSQTIFATGLVTGSVVPAAGDSGFGFDCCFMPAGHNKTYAQMTIAEKDAISHRTLALRDFLAQLKKL